MSFYHRDKELSQEDAEKIYGYFIEVFVFSAVCDCETHMNCRSSCLLHLDEDTYALCSAHDIFRLKLGNGCRRRVGSREKVETQENSGKKTKTGSKFNFSVDTFIDNTWGFLTARSSLQRRSLNYSLTNLLL